MAQDKKSFIAYADWKNIFDELPNEDAGKLIKHIFSYVNDENPESDSILIRAVFANIKSTLKRDLDKWDRQLEQRSLAGKKSAESRKSNPLSKINDRSTTVNETERNPTDNVSVSVSVNVSDSVLSNDNLLLEKETKEKTQQKISEEIIPEEDDIPTPDFDFKKSMLEKGFDKKLTEEWLKVRRAKKAVNTETAFKKFINEVNKSNAPPNDILKICIEQSWKGFNVEWLKNISHGNQQPGQPDPAPAKGPYRFDLNRAIEKANAGRDQ